ncbi:MAG: STN domain-containing protein, partial [Opitutaceae bacterium]
MTSKLLLFRRVIAMGAFALFASVGAMAELTTKTFNVPAGDAETTLRAFSKQAGVQIVFDVDRVSGVRTAAVQGDLSPRAALDRMFAGTRLVAAQDEKTGALTVRRVNGEEKNAPRAAQTRSDRPLANPPVEAVSASTAKVLPPGEQDAIVLSPFEVTTDLD